MHVYPALLCFLGGTIQCGYPIGNLRGDQIFQSGCIVRSFTAQGSDKSRRNMIIFWIPFQISSGYRPIEWSQQDWTPSVENLQRSFVSTVCFPTSNSTKENGCPTSFGISPNISFYDCKYKNARESHKVICQISEISGFFRNHFLACLPSTSIFVADVVATIFCSKSLRCSGDTRYFLLGLKPTTAITRVYLVVNGTKTWCDTCVRLVVYVRCTSR